MIVDETQPPFAPEDNSTKSSNSLPKSATPRTPRTESTVFGMSLRGVIALIIVVTACTMSGLGRKVEEPLYSTLLLVVGVYFGQNKSTPNQNQKPEGINLNAK